LQHSDFLNFKSQKYGDMREISGSIKDATVSGAEYNISMLAARSKTQGKYFPVWLSDDIALL